MGGVDQNIVGGATNDGRLEAWNYVAIDDGAKRTRRENVALCFDDRTRVNGCSIECVDGLLHAVIADVSNKQGRACFVEQSAQIHTDVSESLDCNSEAREIDFSIEVLKACSHAVERALCGEGRWVASMGYGLTSHDMVRFTGHPVDESRVKPHVFSCDVVPIECVYKATHGPGLGFGGAEVWLWKQNDALGTPHG